MNNDDFKKPILSFIIPILNEEDIILDALNNLEAALNTSKFKSHEVKVLICDGGSTDNSLEIVTKYCLENSQFSLHFETLSPPSIGKTVSIGLSHFTGEYLLILPIDCLISTISINALKNIIDNKHYECGGFSKIYSPKRIYFYELLQNIVRAKILKNLVWTNGIWLKRELVSKVNFTNEAGFLEDVILSDQLKKFQFYLLPEHITVSARNYLQSKPIFRIFLNLFIILSFRAGNKDLKQLKSLYKKII